MPRMCLMANPNIAMRRTESTATQSSHTVWIVKDYVREHHRRRREMYVPLVHPPGHGQGDFGEAWAFIGGAKRKVHFFAFDLPQSDASYVRAYPVAAAEAWVDGHVRAFSFFGSVPLSMLYDNDRCLVSRIERDGTRRRTQLFSGFLSHYLIRDRYGRPGKGNDKGAVEGLVGWSRRNFMVPLPRFASFEAFNEYLEQRCRERQGDVLRGHRESIGERLKRDLEAMAALPAAPFDACHQAPGQVSSQSLVRFQTNDYSVPVAYGHRQVWVRGYVEQVLIGCGAEIIARHRRSYEGEETVFDPLHHLPLIERKIGALDQAAPLAGWELPDAFATRRAEIEAAMEGGGLGAPGENQRLAQRAALMTRAAKRDVERTELREIWQRQAAELGFDAKALAADAIERSGGVGASGRGAGKEDRAPGRQADLFDPAPQSPAEAAMAWAVDHLSEREAVFAKADLLAAALSWQPGSVTIAEAEVAAARLEKAGTLHPCGLLLQGELLTTDRAMADEKEMIALMERGRGVSGPVMRRWIAGPLLHNGRLTVGQEEAVKTILSSKDRVVGVQGYAGTGKTTMLDRARALAGKSGYRMIGVAPSASAARTLAAEAGIETETLQRFLARNAGVAEGRLTRKGAKEMRAAFAKTVLVVDEGSLASTVQARDLLRIANAIRIPRVVLVGDAKQLDAVDAGKPFAQLQKAGMTTAVMDEILRQKDAELKAAVRASLAGDVRKAFAKLGDRVAEVNPDNLAGAAAARWLKLSAHERENTGLMAPSHALRREINGHIRERLAREGRIIGPALQGERLVSYGYTNAEKTVAANYAPGDVVAFHRDYRGLGVAKGDERHVAGVDGAKGTVMLEGPEGETVPWRPRRVGAGRGGIEVYRIEGIKLRAGDHIRWTRNDAGLGLVNSDTAEIVSVRGGRVAFRLGGGRTLELARDDPQLRHLDHAWASTVHAFQGRTVDNAIAVMEAKHPHLTTQKSFYVEISRARHNAELVTDDAKALRETLEVATGERISALEGIGVAEKPLTKEKVRGGKDSGRALEAGPEPAERSPGRDRGAVPEKAPEPKQPEYDLEL